MYRVVHLVENNLLLTSNLLEKNVHTNLYPNSWQASTSWAAGRSRTVRGPATGGTWWPTGPSARWRSKSPSLPISTDFYRWYNRSCYIIRLWNRAVRFRGSLWMLAFVLTASHQTYQLIFKAYTTILDAMPLLFCTFETPAGIGRPRALRGPPEGCHRLCSSPDSRSR